MEIIIHQAILHVLDTTMDAPVLSGGPMELTAEKNASTNKTIVVILVVLVIMNLISIIKIF